MQDLTVGALTDALIEDLEGANQELDSLYERLETVASMKIDLEKRIAEETVKADTLRAKLEAKYPALKGLPYDYVVPTAREYRQYNKENGL